MTWLGYSVALLVGIALGWWGFRTRAQKLQALSASLSGDALPHLQKQLERQQQEIKLLKADAQRYGTIVNSSLNPIWVRDENQRIVFCNLAFSMMMEDSDEDIADMELFKGHRQLSKKALGSAQECTERRHLIVEGERRLFHIREVPFPSDGLTIGYAIAIHELEEAQEEIQRHISALRDLLESSISAMAIYGSDMRLKYYNFAFVSLWRLEESWLDTEPTYGEVLEALREKRKLPEQANFASFKQAQLKLFTTLIDIDEGFFYLPDGKTLRVVNIPHALGGILFVYEDVTDRLALERSYNTLIAVQRETLDHLHEGIAVVGEHGRLTLSNPNFRKQWALSDEFLSGEPHVRDWLEKCRALFVTPNWDVFKEHLAARVQARQYAAIRFERTDASVLDCAMVPLPDGAMLLSFTDVTDSLLVERSLREKNEALEAADRLKTEFLANMSYELRSPLTSISGFAEMLTKEYSGTLNAMQKDYVGHILQSSAALSQMIGDIIDLSTMDAGYVQLERTPVQTSAFIHRVIDQAHERLKLPTLKITTHLNDKVWHIDEARMQHALFNMLVHLVRFSKGRRPLHVTLHTGDDGWILNMEEVLAEGEVAAPHTSAPDLGFIIATRFIKLHGGDVTMAQKPTGARFIRCSFPSQIVQDKLAASA